jgi:hypothetical protein
VVKIYAFTKKEKRSKKSKTRSKDRQIRSKLYFACFFSLSKVSLSRFLLIFINLPIKIIKQDQQPIQA